MDKQYILFDLDGTLTDSKEGITKSVQYALKDAGIEEKNLDNLECYIGPPLEESFSRFHGLEGEDIAKAVKKYRERFSDKGLFENKVIEEIEFCLKTLKAADKTLILATCKPEVFSLRIMDYFDLAKYFDVMVGSELNGGRKHKAEVINEAFERLKKEKFNNSLTDYEMNEVKASSVMIGDRDQDVNGAHEAGIECVGVKFGYAGENELEDACADYIVNTVAQLTALLLSE